MRRASGLASLVIGTLFLAAACGTTDPRVTPYIGPIEEDPSAPGIPACDGIDNDGDGLIDEGCEICGDGVDNDGDGAIDELDDCCEAVFGTTICGAPATPDAAVPDPGDGGFVYRPEICGDGIDNDDDGTIDEPDCCELGGGLLNCPDEICGDGIDNDFDGLIDEPDCV